MKTPHKQMDVEDILKRIESGDLIRFDGDLIKESESIIIEDTEWFEDVPEYDLLGVYYRKPVQKMSGISGGQIVDVVSIKDDEVVVIVTPLLPAMNPDNFEVTTEISPALLKHQIQHYLFHKTTQSLLKSFIKKEGHYVWKVNDLIEDIQSGDLIKYDMNLIKESRLSEAKIKVDKSEYIKLFEDDTILVLKPLTHQASCKYGSGAKWCVASRTSDTWWNNYTKKTANFAGTNWYNVKEVVEDVKRTWLDRILGKPGEIVKREIKEFIEAFPVGILYFVISKKRIKSYEWDEELKYNKPIYEEADPKDPMNKLALLYDPGKADFGDLSTSDPHDVFEYIKDKLDASHNNMSIFNALDEKVTLREVSSSIGREFNVAFRFIEEDFQKERNKIDFILKDVLDKVYPLPGDTGSKQPVTWLTGSDGQLYKAKTSDVKKGEKGERRFTGRRYKGHHPNQGNW
jgi:hypothetical protein